MSLPAGLTFVTELTKQIVFPLFASCFNYRLVIKWLSYLLNVLSRMESDLIDLVGLHLTLFPKFKLNQSELHWKFIEN